MTNNLGDMLIRIKNAYLSRHPGLEIPYSVTKYSLAKILKDEGYIQDVEMGGEKTKKSLKVELKYDGKRSALSGVKQVSRPSLRTYMSLKDLNSRRKKGFSLTILSTSKGLLTRKEAIKQKVGGEVICEVW